MEVIGTLLSISDLGWGSIRYKPDSDLIKTGCKDRRCGFIRGLRAADVTFLGSDWRICHSTSGMKRKSVRGIGGRASGQSHNIHCTQ